MWGRAVLALAFVTQAAAQAQSPLTLEIRVFTGAEEVTAETRVTVHRAGERSDPLVQTASGGGRVTLAVPPGIYDVQAIRERDGRVVSIRWAERLVVMPYSDENGHHLEVVNFMNGFGALQVRARQAGVLPEVDIYAATVRDKPIATRVDGTDYALFVVPAGKYDVLIRAGSRQAWQADIDVPPGRTRLLVLP